MNAYEKIVEDRCREQLENLYRAKNPSRKQLRSIEEWSHLWAAAKFGRLDTQCIDWPEIWPKEEK